MNKELMEAAGFSNEIKLVEKNKCPFCKKNITPNEFRNELSIREHKISGLCQGCQDKIFNEQ